MLRRLDLNPEKNEDQYHTDETKSPWMKQDKEQNRNKLFIFCI